MVMAPGSCKEALKRGPESLPPTSSPLHPPPPSFFSFQIQTLSSNSEIKVRSLMGSLLKLLRHLSGPAPPDAARGVHATSDGPPGGQANVTASALVFIPARRRVGSRLLLAAVRTRRTEKRALLRNHKQEVRHIHHLLAASPDCSQSTQLCSPTMEAS